MLEIASGFGIKTSVLISVSIYGLMVNRRVATHTTKIYIMLSFVTSELSLLCPAT